MIVVSSSSGDRSAYFAPASPWPEIRRLFAQCSVTSQCTRGFNVISLHTHQHLRTYPLTVITIIIIVDELTLPVSRYWCVRRFVIRTSPMCGSLSGLPASVNSVWCGGESVVSGHCVWSLCGQSGCRSTAAAAPGACSAAAPLCTRMSTPHHYWCSPARRQTRLSTTSLSARPVARLWYMLVIKHGHLHYYSLSEMTMFDHEHVSQSGYGAGR